MLSCQSSKKHNNFVGNAGEVKVIVLDPGHFHADLLLKSGLSNINDTVYVYAPVGNELQQFSDRIDLYNQRTDYPTSWVKIIYQSDDFLAKMVAEKKGNVVILAGNNKNKTNYILESVKAGLNVLSDKPMAIDKTNFLILEDAFKIAKENNVLIYDVMTERYNILNIIQKELIGDEALFGKLQQGTQENPAVELQSIHHFYKLVSGSPLVRPSWYYDVKQQGEGLVDVTTHLIDIINWKCFPEEALDYKKDVDVVNAKRWPTVISKQQFKQSTLCDSFPRYLVENIKDSSLYVYANGTMTYKVKNSYVKLDVVWNYEASEGGGDTHSSIIRGTKSVCEVVQDKEHQYKPELYIYNADEDDSDAFESNLKAKITKIQQQYPFVSYHKVGNKFRINVPMEFREGHETHFSRVASKYFEFLQDGKMPEWECKNMIAKYYITTTALEIAKKQ